MATKRTNKESKKSNTDIGREEFIVNDSLNEWFSLSHAKIKEMLKRIDSLN